MTTFIDANPVTTGADSPVDEGPRIERQRDATAGSTLRRGLSRTATIADQYSGLLDDLTPGQRRGLIAKLSVGYYDGWRPSRAELAQHIHDELGVTALDPETGRSRPFRNHFSVGSRRPQS